MIVWVTGILDMIGTFYLGMFFYTIFKHKTDVMNIFSYICLAIAVYVIGYGFELRADEVDAIKFFLMMEYFGLTFVFSLWPLFVYEFYFNRPPSVRISFLFFVVPLLTLFFNVSNDYHHLFYASVTLDHYPHFITAHLVKGPLYYVNVVYCYASLLIGYFIFLKPGPLLLV